MFHVQLRSQSTQQGIRCLSFAWNQNWLSDMLRRHNSVSLKISSIMSKCFFSGCTLLLSFQSLQDRWNLSAMQLSLKFQEHKWHPECQGPCYIEGCCILRGMIGSQSVFKLASKHLRLAPSLHEQPLTSGFSERKTSLSVPQDRGFYLHPMPLIWLHFPDGFQHRSLSSQLKIFFCGGQKISPKDVPAPKILRIWGISYLLCSLLLRC